ncbi:MAG: adenylyl-sulfate kinase [Thermotogaceae bacterium]|nr:adenylyl-sulfate kinase [Thermotogaceae bacterium]
MESRLILITGMPSSGKTTLGEALNKKLRELNLCSIHLDGIEFREMIGTADFTLKSIRSTIEAIEKITKVLLRKGIILIITIVGPFDKDRKRLLSTTDSIHVHLECPLEELKKRDFKGVYEKADKGEMILPGYSFEYEFPKNPDLLLKSCIMSVEEEVKQVIRVMKEKGWLN